MLLKKGLRDSPEVRKLQEMLNCLGFPAGVVDGHFGPITYAAVISYQRAKGLPGTGAVNDALWELMKCEYNSMGRYITGDAGYFFETIASLPTLLPQTALDRRLSDAIRLMQTCDNGQGLRYGGWIDPYQFDRPEFRKNQIFTIPRVGKIMPGHSLTEPIHGGTCSPWAGLFLAWYLCLNELYDFRIGRNARWIATWKLDAKYPGFGDYCEVHGTLKLELKPLGMLYAIWPWLNYVNLVEMEHHVIFVLKVGGKDGLHLEDPLQPGLPLSNGLYRFGMDGHYPRIGGKKYYSGTKQTFRKLSMYEKTRQKWDVYRIADPDPKTCSPKTGPLAGRPPWPLGLSSK